MELYKLISKIICEKKDKRGITYCDICRGNEVSTSTYDNLIAAKGKASF